MPWHTSGRFAFSPINVTSKKPYRGINTVCLWAAAQAKGYERGEWATYQQWQERGAQVRKGEKATTGSVLEVRQRVRRIARRRGGTRQAVRVCCSRAATACSMRPKWTATRPRRTRTRPCRNASRTLRRSFRRSAPTFATAETKPSMRPRTDHIQMPPFQAFAENVAYYSTLAHEHTHWTAPAARCDRQLGKRFGDNAYAAEELIAELGAAFTCAHLGLSTEPREDHAQYIQSWLQGAQGGLASHLHGRIQSTTGNGLADRAGG